MPAHREPINASDAPAAVGPYVHAIRSGNLLFCSGQIPLDPRTGDITGASAGAQAGRCLENLAAVCHAAGATLGDAVRLTVYLTDMATFAEFNQAYADAFGEHRPARSTVEVSALPGGMAVEIEAWAYKQPA